jgi:hypothetical protein
LCSRSNAGCRGVDEFEQVSWKVMLTMMLKPTTAPARMGRYSPMTHVPIWFISTLLLASPVLAQERRPVTDDTEHVVVYELGWEGDWSHAEGLNHGATAAVEFTPIARWLEIEIGASAVHHADGTEYPVDVLFKKPWDLSRRVELMAGVGPEVIHATGPSSGTFRGVSAVLDLMVWPTKRVGWYLEPGYEVTFRQGTRVPGIAVAAGLLIGR